MIFSKKAAAFLLAAILLGGSLAPKSYAEAKAIGGRANDDMKIALTFDDGPHPRNTPKILDILAEYGIKATFFEVGENIELYPEVSRRVVAEGHEIGNHTYTHPHLLKTDYCSLLDEIARCEKVITETTGVTPLFFRPPEGVVDENVRKVAEDEGYSIIVWTVDTRDWAGTPTDKIVDTVLREISPGDIILMHDYTSKKCNTIPALRRIIPALRDMGYEFVTVGELLRA